MSNFRIIVRLILVLIIFFSGNVFASRTSVAVFPLKNESGSELHDWAGYGIAETISRRLQCTDGFQVWDPLFLFQTDSSGCDMSSDSLLKIHRNRWQWDVAVGGRYRIINDSLQAKFKLVWASGREEPLKVEIKHDGRLADFFPFCNEAIQKILGVIQARLTAQDSLALHRVDWYDLPAYRTFAAGYGFEMKGDPNAAMTAYARAEEIDPHCALAMAREGLLYRRSNDFVPGRQAFERAFAAAPENSRIAAEYADFLVDCDVPANALKFINSHRELLGKCADGMTAMGKMFMAAGEYQRALALLTKAVAFGPSDLEVEYALGSAYAATGDFTRASDIFNQLIEYQPYNLRYYAALGGAYRKAGRLMESTIVLESAEKIDPDNTMILVDLAHTYIRLGWFEKAGQLLDRAHDISPQLPDISLNLGVVYWYENRQDDALKCFEDAAPVATMRQPAYNNMGNVLFWSGDIGEAIKAYKKAEQAGAANATVLYNLAMAYLARKDYRKAADYFDKMLGLAPDRLDILMQQASIAERLRRYDKAEEYYHSIIQLLPDHEIALRGLLTILLRQKRYKEALQPIEDFLSRQPLNREFMTLLASVYQRMGWIEVALMKYQAVIKEHPDDSAGNLGVGSCMYALIRDKGLVNYDDAILALKKASDYAPGSPVPDMLIGNIYADYKGYRELAMDHWKKALSRAADDKTRKILQKKIAGKG